MKTRRWLLLLLIASFLWLVVTRANEVEHLVETLAGGVWQWILVAGLLQVGYFVTQARIFQVCFSLVGVRSRLVDLVPVFLGSMFINAVAPSGGTAGLALYVDDAVQRGQSGARAAAGTVLGIVGGYAGFGLILVFGLVSLQLRASVRIYEIIAAVALLLFTLLLSGLLVLGALRPQALFSALTAFQRAVNGLASRLGRDNFLGADWAEDMGGEFAAAADAARQNPRGFLAILAWSLLSFLVNASSLFAVFLAFSQEASIPVVLTAFAIGHLFVIMAPSPQGVGFVETILPITLSGLGMPGAAATVVVLAYRGLAFWLPMLAGFFMLQRLRSLGGKEQAIRELWSVRVVAILTAALGLVNVVSATYPALARDLQPVTQFAPLQLRRGGQVGALITGLLLFLLASALWRRKRTAWLITIVVLILSAISLILNSSLLDIRTLLTLSLAGWMLHLRPHFHARSDPPSVRQGAVIILGALTFLLAYGSAGIYVLALRAGEAHNLRSVALTTTNLLFALRPPQWLAASEGGRFLITSVYALAVLTLLYAIFQLLRPVLIPRPATPAERARARVLVTTYGHDATSRLALLPEVSYYFSSGGSVTSFLLTGRTAVALGDPLGPERDALDTIMGFDEHCRRNDWLPAFYHASEAYRPHYDAAGFDTMAVGREAIIDVADFEQNDSQQGALRDVRRLLREGYRAAASMPPHAPQLLEELRLIHDEWLTIMGGDGHWSMLSHFDEESVAQSPVMMTRTPDSLIGAYATLIMDEGHTLAVDILRHRPQIRQGTLPFLFLALIQWAEKRHFQQVNLGAGFPGLVDEELINGRSRQLVPMENGPQVIAHVHEVRARFHPRWRLRYLAYPGATSLPAVWSAVTRAGWNDRWLRLLVRRQLGV